VLSLGGREFIEQMLQVAPIGYGFTSDVLAERMGLQAKSLPPIARGLNVWAIQSDPQSRPIGDARPKGVNQQGEQVAIAALADPERHITIAANADAAPAPPTPRVRDRA
jgi:hypothetical protein